MARTVVAVSTESQRPRLLDNLLKQGGEHDAVILESVERGYARIKREKPDSVIVYLAIDDPAVCRLLAMLTLDPETAGIPVVTWAERFDDGEPAGPVPTAIPESPKGRVALEMN